MRRVLIAIILLMPVAVATPYYGADMQGPACVPLAFPGCRLWATTGGQQNSPMFELGSLAVSDGARVFSGGEYAGTDSAGSFVRARVGAMSTTNGSAIWAWESSPTYVSTIHQIVASHGTLYAFGTRGPRSLNAAELWLAAWNETTGQLAWMRGFPVSAENWLPERTLIASPDGATLYFSAKGPSYGTVMAVALDSRTGSTVWQKVTPFTYAWGAGALILSPDASSLFQSIGAALDGVDQYQIAYDARDGRIKWIGAEGGGILMTDGDTLWAAGGAYESVVVVAYDANTGALEWRRSYTGDVLTELGRELGLGTRFGMTQMADAELTSSGTIAIVGLGRGFGCPCDNRFNAGMLSISTRGGTPLWYTEWQPSADVNTIADEVEEAKPGLLAVGGTTDSQRNFVLGVDVETGAVFFNAIQNVGSGPKDMVVSPSGDRVFLGVHGRPILGRPAPIIAWQLT